jgi:PAS domain S-box-containing protein
VQTAAEGIWMTNADDRTTFVNPTLARMLDYDIEQMMGRAMTDFMDDSGRALLKQHLQRSLSGEAPERRLLPAQRRQHRVVPAVDHRDERRFRPLRRHAGHADRHHRAPPGRGALHESSQRLASIFNAVTNGLVMVDAHGLILERNAAAARMLAHTEELSRRPVGRRARDGTLTTPAATRCNWRWSPACRCATW